ncbi:UNVERIFIED_CONTAM: DeoR faimly transcriptional regulator [Mumia flava]
MRRALQAARDACVRTFPNPRVGCVLLSSDGTVLATGAHRGAGTAHAEADALARAGTRADGSTAVVTLEPCNHQGRTGPCSEALVAAGVRRVVYGQADPNPQAAGGADRLRAAGIDVETGLLADEAAELNREWTFAIRTGRPFVTWKYAASLDGRSAAADGSSRWITSRESRADVQAFRARCDAILVGTGTALADDPRLTLRDDEGAPLPYDQQPLRVVLGERDLPVDARLNDDTAPTLRLRTRDVPSALAELGAREIRHVWLEGGPRLAGAFAAHGLVDEVVGYVAPLLLGRGDAALTEAGVGTVADAHRLTITDVTVVGADVRITARPHDRED